MFERNAFYENDIFSSQVLVMIWATDPLAQVRCSHADRNAEVKVAKRGGKGGGKGGERRKVDLSAEKKFDSSAVCTYLCKDRITINLTPKIAVLSDARFREFKPSVLRRSKPPNYHTYTPTPLFSPISSYS